MRLHIIYSCPLILHIFLCRKLNEIVKNVDEKSNHGMIRRSAEGKKDQGEIAAFAAAISDLVINLQVSSASTFKNGHLIYVLSPN